MKCPVRGRRTGHKNKPGLPEETDEMPPSVGTRLMGLGERVERIDRLGHVIDRPASTNKQNPRQGQTKLATLPLTARSSRPCEPLTMRPAWPLSDNSSHADAVNRATPREHEGRCRLGLHERRAIRQTGVRLSGRSGKAPADPVALALSRQRSPALADIVGDGRPWTVLMISLLSIPCR